MQLFTGPYRLHIECVLPKCKLTACSYYESKMYMNKNYTQHSHYSYGPVRCCLKRLVSSVLSDSMKRPSDRVI